MHARTHLFTAEHPPLLSFPCLTGLCLRLIFKLQKKTKHRSNSSHPTLPGAGSAFLPLASSQAPLWFNTPDTFLTPFPLQLVPFFPRPPLLSYLNLSPYILPAAPISHCILSANQFSKQLFQLIQRFLFLACKPKYKFINNQVLKSVAVLQSSGFSWLPIH